MLLITYMLFCWFISSTLLHNAMRKFGTFFSGHPVYTLISVAATQTVNNYFRRLGSKVYNGQQSWPYIYFVGSPPQNASVTRPTCAVYLQLRCTVSGTGSSIDTTLLSPSLCPAVLWNATRGMTCGKILWQQKPIRPTADTVAYATIYAII